MVVFVFKLHEKLRLDELRVVALIDILCSHAMISTLNPFHVTKFRWIRLSHCTHQEENGMVTEWLSDASCACHKSLRDTVYICATLLVFFGYERGCYHFKTDLRSWNLSVKLKKVHKMYALLYDQFSYWGTDISRRNFLRPVGSVYIWERVMENSCDKMRNTIINNPFRIK